MYFLVYTVLLVDNLLVKFTYVKLNKILGVKDAAPPLPAASPPAAAGAFFTFCIFQGLSDL